jgi:hypothetical protein
LQDDVGVYCPVTSVEPTVAVKGIKFEQNLTILSIFPGAGKLSEDVKLDIKFFENLYKDSEGSIFKLLYS